MITFYVRIMIDNILCFLSIQYYSLWVVQRLLVKKKIIPSETELIHIYIYVYILYIIITSGNK